MILDRRRLLLPVIISFLSFSMVSFGQWDKKGYKEWSEKDALKVLNDSPWGQTQSFTENTGAFAIATPNSTGQSRSADVIKTNFRIRFFSSKPVREAFARSIELQMKDRYNDQVAEKLKALTEAEFQDHVVVAVALDANTPNQKLNQAQALLSRLTTSDLRNKAYLLPKKGEYVYLEEYQPPQNDGFGARFIFPRLVGGEPYLNPETGEINFRAELSSDFTLSMRFRTKNMVYNGKFEY